MIPRITIPEEAWQPVGNSNDAADPRCHLRTLIQINDTTLHLDAYAVEYLNERNERIVASKTDAGPTILQHASDDDVDIALGHLVPDASWPLSTTNISGRNYFLIATPFAR